MNKKVMITVSVLVVLAGIIYANKERIMLKIAGSRAIEWSEFFCDSEDILDQLDDVVPRVTAQWENMDEEDQKFFWICLGRIKSARDYKALGLAEDKPLSNAEFQQMLNDAETHLSDYEEDV